MGVLLFKSKRQIEEAKTKTEQLNPCTGKWDDAIPLPYYYGLMPFLWKRLTGWRDNYGRKAQFMGWD